MARIRTIKPEFWTDSKTGTLSGDATKLFLGILNHCDDYGVIKMDLMEFKAKILPYSSGDANSTITPLLFDELFPRGLLTLFHYSEKDDGVLQQYVYVTNFQRHQRIDKPGAPIIPKWLKTDTLDSFIRRIIEHSENVLITFAPERKGKEGNGVEATKPPLPTKSAIPTDLHELQYAARIIDDLELVSTPKLIEIVGSAVVTAAKRNKSDKSQGFEWLRRRALDAKGSGTAINRFWFEDAEKWDTKNGVDDGISERVAQKYKF